MNRWTLYLAAALLIGLALIGCKRTRTPNAIAISIEAPAQPAADTTSGGRGSIHGKTLFTGKGPAPRPINNQACHNNHPREIFDEAVVINANGTLKNFVVYPKKAPGAAAIPTATSIIDQVDCHYVPHVTAITAGQKIIFKSSDPTLHNVHLLGNGAN